MPENHQRIPLDIINRAGALLFNKACKLSTKQAILIILAHHPTKTALDILKRYNIEPDKDLEIFAQFALDECIMWNE